MAYAIRGCGVVLQSDVHKRNSAALKVGRRPVPPVVSSLFIHSRASYMSGLGARNSVGDYEHDPFLDTFLGPIGAGTNMRIALLQTMKKKELAEAAEKDAELGLNFTIASNWKQAAKKEIKDANDFQSQHRPKFSDAQQRASAQQPPQEEADTDRIWKQRGGSREAPMLVFRGTTASDRREVSYTANADALGKPYSDQDPRLFFSGHAARHRNALPPSVIAATMRGSVPAVPPLQLESALPSRAPSGSTASRAPSSSQQPPPKLALSNVFAAVPSAATDADRELHQHLNRQLSSHAGGWTTGRGVSALSRGSKGGRRSRPVSGVQSARGSSSARGLGAGGATGVKGGKERQLPTKSFEEAPHEWHAFASKCFVEGDWETAKRALRALDIGDGIVGHSS